MYINLNAYGSIPMCQNDKKANKIKLEGDGRGRNGMEGVFWILSGDCEPNEVAWSHVTSKAKHIEILPAAVTFLTKGRTIKSGLASWQSMRSWLPMKVLAYAPSHSSSKAIRSTFLGPGAARQSTLTPPNSSSHMAHGAAMRCAKYQQHSRTSKGIQHRGLLSWYHGEWMWIDAAHPNTKNERWTSLNIAEHRWTMNW